MSRSKAKGTDERLWAKVEKTDGCWLWSATRNTDGYGMFWLDGRMRLAHRVSWEMSNGVLEQGLLVDHLCFEHRCVKPAHLRTVDHKQNNEHRIGPNANGALGTRGVSYRKGRSKPYKVRVGHNGVAHYGGYFATLEEATNRARELRAKLFTHDDWSAA